MQFAGKFPPSAGRPCGICKGIADEFPWPWNSTRDSPSILNGPFFRKGQVMKIPTLVAMLVAAMLGGLSLIFFVM